MTYIQKNNIYTSIQEMLKCEVHLNNIEKQKACLVLVVLQILLFKLLFFLRDKDKGVKVGRQKER